MIHNMERDIVRRLAKLERQFVDMDNPEYLAPVISAYLSLPGLRGFWPMSSVGDSGLCVDLSGQGRDLTYNGNPVYGVDGIVPYIDLDGTGDYLSRADEAGLDIIGNESYIDDPGLVFGCWVNFTNAAASVEYIMSKITIVGSTQAAYGMLRQADGLIRAWITSDGSTFYAQTSVYEPPQSEWTFVAGRFNPSTEVAVFTNNMKEGNTTSIPATIYNTSGPFSISGIDGSSFLMTGKVAFGFLCAAFLSNTIMNHIYQTSRGLFGV